MTDKSLREQLIDLIKKEFIGPDPIQKPGFVQENGEEILISDSPLKRYSAGILFPVGAVIDELTNADQEPSINVEQEESELMAKEKSEFSKSSGWREWVSENEEIMNLSNAYRQSAISMTISTTANSNPEIEVKYGVYSTEGERYCRQAKIWNNEGIPLELPDSNNRVLRKSIEIEDGKKTLELSITYRGENKKYKSNIYTFSLINRRINNEKNNSLTYKVKDCYFQAEFRVSCGQGFSPLPENKKITTTDEDYLSNMLLYRNVKNYAIGHGCSTNWIESGSKVTDIETSIIPQYEIKPTIPSIIPGVSLDMYNLSDKGNFEQSILELERLCDEYIQWINKLENEIPDIEQVLVKTAQQHIKNCRNCHSRMIEGLKLLKTDNQVRKAFQYMNRAMLLQQLHYNLPRNEWSETQDGTIILSNLYRSLPEIDNVETWYDKERLTYGKWRPFQLAFILMNLKSMVDRTSEDRKLVDLIWFPTGGGKTEAYLGLSAYTIFIRKLLNPAASGTAIIMRYTLRLLSAQQYDRASAMICACEYIRREKQHELGNSRITIGMWVGGETTPNNQKNAIEKFRSIYKDGIKEDYPFIILKCPWCGAAIGPVSIKKGRETRIPGIKISDDKRVRFQCLNSTCTFSSDEFPLPMTVIDEDIYNEPSTLIIGTVDKFAMLPYLPEAQTIFGIHDGIQKDPPDLIIQDELHLISGPLGSMVGHYEVLINELCLDRRGAVVTAPKIIASTATISRAKEQCRALYDRLPDQVIQFPPSGINAGETFFSKQDNTKPGRTYVGIMASAASSYSTGNIRLHAALLYAAKALVVKEEKDRDPYWTILGYFNSLRELGQTATWISADIEEYLHSIYLRRKADKEDGYKENRRYINSFEELTSRIQSNQIPAILQKLGVRYPSEDKNGPIDLCLATNMISVGVDVSRLGLMTVTGQPKTTAEYIQSTSRVGRDPSAPGVVFISYSPTKPRDRSHYEHFRSYHAKIYSHVEPTSVTPFSAPLRQRALHALLIGLVRLNGNKNTFNDPAKMSEKNIVERYIPTILKRIANIEPSEEIPSKKKLDEILRNWKNWMPTIYDAFPIGTILPLMIQAGSGRHQDWEGAGFETPMSMRSTDVTCEVKILSKYSMEDEQDV